ncbi:MAG TPA: hypothetical protein VL132_01265 [Planctomycetaceae bacterium]|nr:hypothetical protein [Planctomycetaceae bacterium]
MTWPSGQNEPSSTSHDQNERDAAWTAQYERGKSMDSSPAPGTDASSSGSSNSGPTGGGGNAGGCGGCLIVVIGIAALLLWQQHSQFFGNGGQGRQVPIPIVKDPVPAPWDPGNAPPTAESSGEATPTSANVAAIAKSPVSERKSESLVHEYLSQVAELIREREERLAPDLAKIGELKLNRDAGRLTAKEWLDQTNAINRRIAPDRAVLKELTDVRTRVRSSYVAYQDGKLSISEEEVVHDAEQRLRILHEFHRTGDLGAFKRSNAMPSNR